MERRHSTTIIAVLRDGIVAMAGDGQVTQGEVVIKHTARKIRRLYHNRVLAGFAGGAADGITLLERLEAQLEQSGGQLLKATVDLAKDWRSDKFLRRLEAEVIAATPDELLVVTGTGEVFQPDEGLIAIGSGGAYAQAAAQALLRHTGMGAREMVRSALEIAASLCIYTNDRIAVESLPE